MHAYPKAAGDITVMCLHDDGKVVIKVADTGIGIKDFAKAEAFSLQNQSECMAWALLLLKEFYGQYDARTQHAKRFGGYNGEKICFRVQSCIGWLILLDQETTIALVPKSTKGDEKAKQILLDTTRHS